MGKLSHHEIAFRTPILLSWPGHVPSGEVRDDLVSTADLYPTLLGFAGIQAPAGRAGRDLRPLFEKPDGRERGQVIGATTFLRSDPAEREEGTTSITYEWNREMVFHLTSADWHYVYDETRQRDWLYDRPSDPFRARDRIRDHRDVARRFRRRVAEWSEHITQLVRPESP